MQLGGYLGGKGDAYGYLAQKIALETFERKPLATANRSTKSTSR
jgi:hypothetical protein